MFEIPEVNTLARQINETLTGKIIRAGSLGNSPHKFVWYNQTQAEFSRLAVGKRVGTSCARGKWLFIPLEPGYILLFGECGGRLLYHAPGEAVPSKYHLHLAFEDGSQMSAMTQMWGAMELYPAGQEQQRQYIQGMRTTPVEAGFTREYFASLIAELISGSKRSVKSLLTQDQLLPGIGNGMAQDILFKAGLHLKAGLHPRHTLELLDPSQQDALYAAILEVVQQVIDLGGRSEEVDLFNRPGGYQRIMDSHAVGLPCPRCGHTVEKMQYLGGACYFCPCRIATD